MSLQVFSPVVCQAEFPTISPSRLNLRSALAGLVVMLMMVAAVVLPANVAKAAADAQAVQTFTLQDHVAMDWSHELVMFDLSADAAQAAAQPENFRLLSPQGQPVPFQIVSENDAKKIAFHVDLPSLQKVDYKLVAASSAHGSPAASDVSVKRQGDVIQLTNGLTGLEIAATLEKAKQGPLQRIRMPDGAWVGSGSLSEGVVVESYEARITDQGPVFASVQATTRLAGGSTWQVTFRLAQGEPVAIIDERIDDHANLKDASYTFTLEPGAAPTNLLYRVGWDRRKQPSRTDVLLAPTIKTPAADAKRSPVWTLRPWHLWWSTNDATAYQLMRLPGNLAFDPKRDKQEEPKDWYLRAKGSDAQAENVSIPSILIGAGKAATWASKGHAFALRPQADGSFTVTMGLGHPAREWLLGSKLVTQSHFSHLELIDARAMVVKHLDRPLDEIRQWVLNWPSDPNLEYPLIFPKEEELAELRKQGRKIGFDLKRYRKARKEFILSAERNPEQVEGIGKGAVGSADRWGAGIFLNAEAASGNGRNPAINSSHHRIGSHAQTIAMNADMALGYGNLSQDQRDLLRARLAVTAYFIAAGDSVNPELGLAQLENMTAFMYGGLSLIASVIPDHPEAKKWASLAARQNDRFLDDWSGPNGGWIEAPHYQLASLASMLLVGIANDRAGISDFVYDERLKRAVLFLAKICTPNDPRLEGFRHIPPLGNTYLLETSNLFGIMASLYEKRDPEFASHMQWMWKQQGEPTLFVIGGDVNINWLGDFMYRDIEPKQPDWGSEMFPMFGAVLRHGFATKHETYMVYHQGTAGGHYDVDQASFELWAKGQPLMLDWGYQGSMPAWMHNTASFSERNAGPIRQFQTLATADHVRSQLGQWQREIVFAKDPKADGPAYFLIQDRVEKITTGRKEDPAIWYWFDTPQTPRLDGQQMHVKGRQDVNISVWLDDESRAAMPMYSSQEWAAHLKEAKDEADTTSASGKPVRTHVETVPAWEGRVNKYWHRGYTTQHGLAIPVSEGKTVTALLLPWSDSETQPVVTSLAEGKCWRVKYDAGTDYLFFSDEPMDVTVDGNMQFRGRAGLVQVREDGVHLTLIDGQYLRHGQHQLEGESGQTKKFGM